MHIVWISPLVFPVWSPILCHRSDVVKSSGHGRRVAGNGRLLLQNKVELPTISHILSLPSILRCFRRISQAIETKVEKLLATDPAGRREREREKERTAVLVVREPSFPSLVCRDNTPPSNAENLPSEGWDPGLNLNQWHCDVGRL